MKKILLYIFICAATLSACQKDKEDAFDKSSDQRLNEALATYQAQLLAAPNGWKATVRPGAGGRYSFFFRFNNANRVFMFSDFSTATAGTRGESSYRLKALQQPSLLFDTYSYLHILSDPDDGVNGGTVGEGLKGDFEYYFEKSNSADSIILIGRVNKTRLTLVRASVTEAAAYEGGKLANFTALEDNYGTILQYWKNTLINGVTYDVIIDKSTRTITFSWKDGAGVIHTFTTGYYITIDGIILNQPFVNGATNISSFSAITFNTTTQVIGITSNSIVFNVAGSNTPAANDPGSPRAWYQQSVAADTSYWYTVYGFNINGDFNAHNLPSLSFNANYPYYYYMVYWPQFNPGEDFVGPIFLSKEQDALTLAYGLASEPMGTTTPGYHVFENFGEYGTYPSSGPALNFAIQLYSGGGYYFKKVGENSYDMISRADSKIWLRWFLAL